MASPELPVIPYNPNANIVEKAVGNFISAVFHPLFVPVYVIAFLLYVHPSAFTGFTSSDKFRVLLIILLNIVFFPLITILLLKALGFISSIQLHTRKDRIIPYIAAGIFFFWAFNVFREQPQYSILVTKFLLATFLSASAALIANIYFKISMHAIAMGGMITFFLLMFFSSSMFMAWPIASALIIGGFVCTSRLMVSSHRPVDIYFGIVVGIICQIAAWYFV